jgi:hypothetical protein
MRCASRLLVVGLFALLVFAPVGVTASAATHAHAAASVVAVDQPPPATPTTTAPAGPQLDPEQAPDKSRQKLVIGFFAAVLLVIVFFGRRSKNKRTKKAKSAVTN